MARRKRTASQLRHAAYHEAGHAVAQRVVGMVCGEATIIPDWKEMTGGFAIAHDHWTASSAWERHYKYRHERSVLRGRIIGYMAGKEAEIIAFGEHNGGDGDDLLQIALMAEEADISMSYLERLRPKVSPLLRRHWRKVEAVAEALLLRRSLSGDEIDVIIRKVTPRRERQNAKRIEAARIRYHHEHIEKLRAG